MSKEHKPLAPFLAGPALAAHEATLAEVKAERAQLLEALQAVRIEMKNRDRNERDEWLYRGICAAIAKATGETIE